MGMAFLLGINILREVEEHTYFCTWMDPAII